jgi:hypothetical protein
MTKLYKLTDQNWETYGGYKWAIGKTFSVKKCKTPSLCSNDVLHAYKNPNLALFLNPIHANVKNPVLFECIGDVIVEDWGKAGVFELKINKILPLPQITTEQRIQFAIYCAREVLPIFEKQHPGDNAPRLAIESAEAYLRNPCEETAGAADAAARAADAAAYAAARADYAAYAAARAAAYAAADAAADAVAYAARAATYAADYADGAGSVDFSKLADKAIM